MSTARPVYITPTWHVACCSLAYAVYAFGLEVVLDKPHACLWADESNALHNCIQIPQVARICRRLQYRCLSAYQGQLLLLQSVACGYLQPLAPLYDAEQGEQVDHPFLLEERCSLLPHLQLWDFWLPVNNVLILC